MLPTMSVTGEVVWENRMITPHRLSRGDLVTYVSPLDPTRLVCKRLIGLPGDVVCVDPTGTLAPSTEHVVVPKNHVWLIGDNAAASRDSRVYGPVSMALIKGRLVARVSKEYPYIARDLMGFPGLASVAIHYISKQLQLHRLSVGTCATPVRMSTRLALPC